MMNVGLKRSFWWEPGRSGAVRRGSDAVRRGERVRCNGEEQWVRYNGRGDGRSLACEVTQGNEDSFEKWTKGH